MQVAGLANRHPLSGRSVATTLNGCIASVIKIMSTDCTLVRICSICARGGSKGVKNKNILALAGRPLIAHSIDQARRSGLFAAIVVSSDSEAILETARRNGVDFLVRRPDELATDNAAKLPVIRHCAAAAEQFLGRQADVFVDLDATSPLRSVDDISNVVALVETRGVGNVITGTPSRRSPYFNMVEIGDDGAPRLVKALPNSVHRRQDAPACFDMNASIYAWTRDALFTEGPLMNDQTRLFVMPEERSLDIDSALDFQIVEMLMTRSERKTAES